MHPRFNDAFTRLRLVLPVWLTGFFLTTCGTVDPLEKLLVSTRAVEAITTQGCRASGMLSDLPEGGIADHGFCWATHGDPGLGDEVLSLGTDAGTGVYSEDIVDLQPGTHYYLRAYGTVGTETIYGETLSFETLQGSLPLLDRLEVVEVNGKSVQVSGRILDNGGCDIETMGICWNASGNPTIHGEKLEFSSVESPFSRIFGGLRFATTYYVCAYASNAVGTAYSTQTSFTTKPDPGSVPVLSTAAISEVGETSAICGGNISSDGGKEITSRGICWSTRSTPSLGDNKTVDGSGAGSFVSSLSGLQSATKYYVRAYAINENGPAYGEEIAFTTLATSSNALTDYRGNEYTTVQIGEQPWRPAI